MPWQTPDLETVRTTNRDYIAGKLGTALIPNSQVRVLADTNANGAHLNLQYLDWLSLQLLPDTAEEEFLDKWGNIYLVNADGSRGRKQATFAAGTVMLTGLAGTIVPAGSQMTGPSAAAVSYETTAQVLVGNGPTPVAVRALDAGAAGNLDAGAALSLTIGLAGLDATATVVTLTGGAEQENNDELRERVLARIRQPPMGGDADDYANWSLAVAGVTRAWVEGNAMGPGTVSVRIMCDDLRASAGGLPTADDLAAVKAYLQTVRPVSVKELYVLAPIFQPISFTITNLVGDSVGLRAAIAKAAVRMLRQRAKPAYTLNGIVQPATTIPAAWVSEAIYTATNGAYFDLVMADAVMASSGCLAVLGAIGS